MSVSSTGGQGSPCAAGSRFGDAARSRPLMFAAQVLFTLVGAFWFMIGVLGALLIDRGIGQPMIFISERSDTALYGGHPGEILERIPELRILRHTTVKGALSGTLVASEIGRAHV